jgi:gamma-glutamylputrescine oxidase
VKGTDPAGRAPIREPADSYYAASANPATERAPLAGAVDCDVCVVGAGITGCSAALNLAERGYRVVLLEGHRVGHGGSGRSGGQMIYGYARDMPEVERLVSAEDAQRLWQLSQEAIETTVSRIRRHAIQCDLNFGHLSAAIKPRQHEELIRFRHYMEDRYGYAGMELLTGAALRAQIDSTRYVAALRDARSGHLHPLNYTLGLAAAAQAAGVIIHEHSPAQRIITGERCVVQTPGGQVRCRFLVLTGGAYMDELVPELRRKIMPVGTYITATEPLGEERARRLLPHNAAVTDTNFVLDYFRRTADHRLLFGGRVSYSTFQPPRLAAILRQRMLQVFPPLADVRQAYTWGGFVDITINRFPHFGRIAPNAFFAHGFSGHGIALTGLAGKLLAEAVAGQAERFDLFAKVRHRDFPGGKAMRMPLLVIAMTWFRLRDLL